MNSKIVAVLWRCVKTGVKIKDRDRKIGTERERDPENNTLTTLQI